MRLWISKWFRVTDAGWRRRMYQRLHFSFNCSYFRCKRSCLQCNFSRICKDNACWFYCILRCRLSKKSRWTKSTCRWALWIWEGKYTSLSCCIWGYSRKLLWRSGTISNSSSRTCRTFYNADCTCRQLPVSSWCKKRALSASPPRWKMVCPFFV